MSQLPPTRRRWLQFSLRTMFVVVTVLAIFIAYHVNWIRQRHRIVADSDYFHKVTTVAYYVEGSYYDPAPRQDSSGFSAKRDCRCSKSKWKDTNRTS